MSGPRTVKEFQVNENHLVCSLKGPNSRSSRCTSATSASSWCRRVCRFWGHTIEADSQFGFVGANKAQGGMALT